MVARGLAGPGRVVRAVVDDLITTFFPADCRVCGGSLVRAGLAPVCDACVAGISAQSMALCERCGEALDLDGLRFAEQFPAVSVNGPSEGLLCSPCRMVAPEFARAVAYGVYQDELREMVHLLKYERMPSVARLLGGMLAESVMTLRGEAAQELLVVAVPLFPVKERHAWL